MDKKVYIQPSLKAHNMEEELLNNASGDVNISEDTTPDGDGSDAGARQHFHNYSVWDEEEE